MHDKPHFVKSKLNSHQILALAVQEAVHGKNPPRCRTLGITFCDTNTFASFRNTDCFNI
jgi:hypothetical protein